MAAHQDFTTATGVPVYFCEPHLPWQCGANERLAAHRFIHRPARFARAA